jgi:hypothetical protein
MSKRTSSTGRKFTYPSSLPKMNDGGKVKDPIYVTDPNDPRLLLYTDSLNLHNQSMTLYNNEFKDLREGRMSGLEWINLMDNIDDSPFNRLKNRIGTTPKPERIENFEKDGYNSTIYLFQEPNQPVLLQKTRPKEEITTLEKKTYNPNLEQSISMDKVDRPSIPKTTDWARSKFNVQPINLGTTRVNPETAKGQFTTKSSLPTMENGGNMDPTIKTTNTSNQSEIQNYLDSISRGKVGQSISDQFYKYVVDPKTGERTPQFINEYYIPPNAEVTVTPTGYMAPILPQNKYGGSIKPKVIKDPATGLPKLKNNK